MDGVTGLTPQVSSLCVNTIRMLAVDAVEAAKSGHPGAPMGAADMAFVLWTRFLRFNPADTGWRNRDRFVLSGGHASMLLYALLHLSGYDLPLEEIKRFRQWGSKTPGHPEYGHTPGVEVTTGPLGQGVSHAVGMALAAEMAAARFNTSDFSPVDHYVYTICGDGDLMEGISGEAASLAGHLGLGRLICLYDANQITIDGGTDVSFTEDVGQRFTAYGWHVQQVDGHDHEAVAEAIAAARRELRRPSMIIARTVIGYGSPNKAGSSKAHGAPLGGEEVRLTKEKLGWPQEPAFLVPDEVRAVFRTVQEQRQQEYSAWTQGLTTWQQAHPDLAELWRCYQNREIPADLDDRLLEGMSGVKAATRALSEKVIQKAAAAVPFLVGGSADLAESNKTLIAGGGDVIPGHGDGGSVHFAGRNLFFGVREHAMGAIVNGLVLYGGFQAYGATFLVFSDYMRSSVRLAALMNIPSIFIFTHDSFFVGEDGPTHQPVEHVWSLRLIPNLTVFRPADGVETAMAWSWALSQAKGPTTLVLTRQNLPSLPRPAAFTPRQVWQGGYIVVDTEGAQPDLVLVGTGSEVSVAVEARELLAADGIRARVVSMPSLELFEQQPAAYRQSVLGGDQVPVAVVEAGRTDGWYRYAGRNGLVIGLDHFGASAPAEVLAREFGFTPEGVAARIRQHLGR